MEVAQALKCLAALAHPTRLTAFRMLVRRGPEGVPAGDIAERLAVPSSTLSFHLKDLENAGLLTVRRQQRQLFYAVGYGAVRQLMDFLREDCCQDHPDICGCPEPRVEPALKPE